MNPLLNTENMLHPEVRELQRADNRLILRRWQKTQPPEWSQLPPPASLSPKARQKSKPETTKHSPGGCTHPMDHASSTQSMGGEAADSVNELKVRPQRAEILSGLCFVGRTTCVRHHRLWALFFFTADWNWTQLKSHILICSLTSPADAVERAQRKQRTKQRAAQEGRAGKTWDHERGSRICRRSTKEASRRERRA